MHAAETCYTYIHTIITGEAQS